MLHTRLAARAALVSVLFACAFAAPAARGADDVAALEDRLARDPENPAHYEALGAALLAAGDAARAARIYGRFADLKPNDCGARLGLARAHRAQGLSDHAMRAGEEARKLCPEDAEIAVELGRAYEAGRDPIAAIESLRRAIELDAARLDAYDLLAAAYEVRGLVPEALAVAEGMMLRPGLEPGTPLVNGALARLARLALASGSRDRAALWAERALAAGAVDAAGLARLDDGFAAGGDCRVRIQMLLGAAWEKSGDAKRARDAYARVLGCGDELREAEARAAIARLDAASARRP